MSGGFGGGFGGDFDDLLPTGSHPPAPPNLGNPFEDPFADIGRPNENDPWATYGQTKPQSPTATFSQGAYETPRVEIKDQSTRELGFGSSPPSPVRETLAATSYPAPQQEHIDPFSTADTSPLDYRAAAPTLPEPAAVSHDDSIPVTPTAPITKENAVPISPSKAGLFDEPSSSTFGSGFIRRHKSQRSSQSNSPVAASSEARSSSLFSSAKPDPLEALVSKARSASRVRTTSLPPKSEITPRPEVAPDAKDELAARILDPLAAEGLVTAQPAEHETPVPAKGEPLSELTSPPKPSPVMEDGISTPKEPPVSTESPIVENPPTTFQETSVTPTTTESNILPSGSQPEETLAPTPTPPSRAASEALTVSQYPEGSTILNPPQESPGPSAYARVVSPLDTPAESTRNLTQSFSGLALGGEVPNTGWGAPVPVSEAPEASLSPMARATGWGAVDATDGWGGEASHTVTAWGGEGEMPNSGQTSQPEQRFRGDDSTSRHSRKQSESNESEGSRKEASADLDRSNNGTPQQSTAKTNEPNGPFTFVITVGDPQKVGDPINPYIVYTVSTKTNSPHYRKPNFSVLRRYSDFLWLFETLSLNKPGVFIPPVPEKQGFGRFQGAFVESRRLALNNCIQKIASHPILSSDDDFKFFIESDSFALDVKHRKAEIAQEKTGGFLSSITGPRFYETDEWFDAKRSYIDALESQLRGLAKSVEAVSKQQAEVAAATGEFAGTLVVLSTSDLSKQLSQSLATLADVHKKARKLEEEQSQDDIILLMGIVEEYIRLIGSIRLTFASRIRLHAAWQNANAEAKRVRTAHEKARRQGRIPQDRVGASMQEMAEAEKRAADAKFEFDQCSRLIKAEMARFEKERIDDFKKNLELLLEGMIQRQQDIIESLENYQEGLLRRSKSILGQPTVPGQSKSEENPVPPEDTN
ncbi:Sorting nexin-1 protein [Ceratobasidium theobromae]|uniref:Sorting nexin-1 protein n=1 Tax=Ceratobasidium theobromae TaxID=1582974 RepID=A0A5N5QE26_9AGAM|nr:Sorting nexin-1 protein [Ceratobasidium theobromae]